MGLTLVGSVGTNVVYFIINFDSLMRAYFLIAALAFTLAAYISVICIVVVYLSIKIHFPVGRLYFSKVFMQ